ncbi:MAG: hypothetical protein IPM29_19795 [Planctomycetes bacterium]|nr:hypothetical protein [Planctomycetota bacterium]
MVELHQQAVAQVARADARWVEAADDLDRALGERGRHQQRLGDLLGVLLEAAVAVEREHDVLDHAVQLGRHVVEHPHLLEQVVGERDAVVRRVVERLEPPLRLLLGAARGE